MKKKLLYVTSIFPNPREGGLGPYNREQVLSLSEHYDIDVVAPVSWHRTIGRGPFPRCWKLGQASVHHPVFLYPPGCLQSLHGHFYYLTLRRQVRRLMEQRNYSVILGTWLFPDAWGARKLAADLGIPYFVKVHGSDVNRLPHTPNILAPSLEVVSDAAGVFCVSSQLKTALVGHGADPAKLHVVSNGIDHGVFYPRSRNEARKVLGLEPDRAVLLFVGNLKREKGLAELVLALKKLQEQGGAAAKLHVVGEGPYAPTFKELVRGYHLEDSVVLLGSKEPREVALWMSAASVLCLPSYAEGMPNVVLEALSCGTPVVASAVGGLLGLPPNPNLSLVPVRDAGAICQAVAATLASEGRDEVSVAVPSWADQARVVACIMNSALSESRTLFSQKACYE